MYQLSLIPLNDSLFSGIHLTNCGHQRCTGPYETRPGIRSHFSLHLVAGGQGYFRSQGKEWRLRPGDGFLIWPGEVISYQASEECPWEYYFITFLGPDASSLAMNAGLSPENPIFYHAAILENMKRLFQLGNEKQSLLPMHALLLECFSALSSPLPSAAGGEYLKNALNYLQQNYAYPLEVGEIARQVGVDRTYLFRLFKQATGQSPQMYLRFYRLQKARELLFTTRLTLDEIAASTGLGSAAHLSKAFRSQYGCTPGALRKKK